MTMKSVDLPHLRSVVLAGHAGGGKTTLAEQLLFRAGAIPRLGKVDDGTAHLDFEPEEQKRRESLSLAVGTFEHDGTRISLVDTPGYPDFVADVIEGFAAVDGALFVVDASAGIEAGLEQAVALGRSTGRAACFFINKSDRENADPMTTLDALRATFGDKIAPLQVAIGAAESFSGYVDLVHRKAYQWDGSKETEIPIPEELSAEVDRFNRHAEHGTDPDFGRGASAYNRAMGDPGHRPNPSIGPLARAPYYAVQVVPSDIGTCGGLQPDLSIGDLIIAMSAVPADATATHLIGGEPHAPTASWELVHDAAHAAKKLDRKVRVGPIVSSDVFYNPDGGQYERWSQRGILGVEMEAAALFTVGALRGVSAGCLLTVSDIVVEGEFVRITDDELRAAVDRMTRIALETATAGRNGH